MLGLGVCAREAQRGIDIVTLAAKGRHTKVEKCQLTGLQPIDGCVCFA
jgi:hypothetical protein